MCKKIFIFLFPIILIGESEKWDVKKILKGYIKSSSFALNSFITHEPAFLYFIIYKTFEPFYSAMGDAYAKYSKDLSKELPYVSLMISAAGSAISHIAIGTILEREVTADFDPCYGTRFLIRIDSVLAGDFKTSVIEVKIVEGIGDSMISQTTIDEDDYPWFPGEKVLLFMRSYPYFCKEIAGHHSSEIGWESDFFEVPPWCMYRICTDSLGIKQIQFHTEIPGYYTNSFPYSEAMKVLGYVIPLAKKWQKEVQNIPFDTVKVWVKKEYEIWFIETLKKLKTGNPELYEMGLKDLKLKDPLLYEKFLREIEK